MSCISTLYTLPILLEAAFCEAKANEKREIQKKILFITRRETVGEKYLWEFLDEVCTKKKEPDYSGFYVIDYLWTYLQIDRIQCFTPVDDNYQKLSHEGAKSLSGPFARKVAVAMTGIFGGGGGQIAYNMTDSSRDWHQGALAASLTGAIGQGIGNRYFPTNNMSTIRQFNKTHAFSTSPSHWLSGNSGKLSKAALTSSLISGTTNFK